MSKVFLLENKNLFIKSLYLSPRYNRFGAVGSILKTFFEESSGFQSFRGKNQTRDQEIRNHEIRNNQNKNETRNQRNSQSCTKLDRTHGRYHRSCSLAVEEIKANQASKANQAIKANQPILNARH